MIIFEPGGSKNLILVILVVFFISIIAWQWVASNPFANVKKQNYFLTEIKDRTSDSVEGIKNSIEVGKDNFSNIGDDIVKQSKQEQLIAEAKKYLADKEKNINITPVNQADCETMNGQWNEDEIKCYVATDDAGQECSDSSQCQGYCAADLPEIYNKFISEGQSVEINGLCSENVIKYGCLAIVEQGLVNEIICTN